MKTRRGVLLSVVSLLLWVTGSAQTNLHFPELPGSIDYCDYCLAAQGIYDEWVRRSYADLAQLKPGRYARDERAAEATAGNASTAPEAAAAVNREGVLQRRDGNFAAARAAYERALTLDPTHADAERNLAILLDLYLDDPSAALPHYERCQALTQGTDKEVTAWLVELKTRLTAVTRTAVAQP